MSFLEIEEVTGVLVEAVTASMTVVRSKQFDLAEGKLKSDGSSVTETDYASQRAGLAILKKVGLDLWPEEGELPEVTTPEVLLFDPIDGTRPFINGGITSVVIAAGYNRQTKRIVRCVVGEPASGRMWLSESGLGTWFFKRMKGSVEHDLFEAKCSSVWTGVLGPRSTVLLDLYPTFTKVGRRDIADEVWARFFSAIYGRSAVSMFGSNGIHHALVAHGGEGVVGAVTTALGGPWDVAPVLLVLESGGVARAFKLPLGGGFEECDPLNVTEYHFLVTGNNQNTVDVLSDILEETIG